MVSNPARLSLSNVGKYMHLVKFIYSKYAISTIKKHQTRLQFEVSIRTAFL